MISAEKIDREIRRLGCVYVTTESAAAFVAWARANPLPAIAADEIP